MALAQCKRAAGVRGAAASRARTVRVSCQKGALQQVSVAAASFAAAVMLAQPADAGVVLIQPERKKLFQSDETSAAAPVKRELKALGAPSTPAPAAAAAPAPKAESSSEGADLDPRSVALPGALALVLGGAFAASKIDGGFDKFIMGAMYKDSTDYAGYEPTLKVESGPIFPKSAGTKKVSKAASGTVKKSFFDFGKK